MLLIIIGCWSKLDVLKLRFLLVCACGIIVTEDSESKLLHTEAEALTLRLRLIDLPAERPLCLIIRIGDRLSMTVFGCDIGE